MRRGITALLLALACLLTGCASPERTGTSTDGAYTFTDAAGTVIVLRERPQRVAVLFSSYAEIWSLAGGTVAVTVGESVQRGFASPDVTLVDAGAGKTIDHELLLAAQPDLVIGSADIAAQVKACELMAGTGVPAALFRVDTVEDYLAMLRICTHITGNEAAYQTYGVAVAEEIEAIKEAVNSHLAAGGQARTLLFIRAGSQDSSTKAKRAPDHFVCTMLDELGGHNIADDAAVLLDGLSLEEILRRDPDYIFLTSMGDEAAAVSYIEDLFARDGWRELTAVKHKQYTFLSKELFHFKPNARWAEAYAVLAQLLYPELIIHG